MTVAEVVAIVVSLVMRSVVTTANVITLIVVGLVGTATVAAGAVLITAPTLRRLATGLQPTDAQLRSATKVMRRQTAILFGTIATVCTGFLFTMRTLRPLLAGVPAAIRPAAPSVRARLLLMWTVCTALPGLAIAILLIMRSYGLLIDDPPPSNSHCWSWPSSPWCSGCAP